MSHRSNGLRKGGRRQQDPGSQEEERGQDNVGGAGRGTGRSMERALTIVFLIVLKLVYSSPVVMPLSKLVFNYVQ